MPLWLRKRDAVAREAMDDPHCSTRQLANTYRQFTRINRRLSRWDHCFAQWIVPLCRDPKRTYTLLDIGFGGGDIPLWIAEEARRAGITLRILAIDPDPRALAYVEHLDTPDSIQFRCTSYETLLQQGDTFDFVISNHLLHHLDEDQIRHLLDHVHRLATRRILFNDLRRSDWAWLLFYIGTLGRFRDSFIRPDGLCSIRRSYRCREMAALLPADWTVHPLFPFRLVVTRP